MRTRENGIYCADNNQPTSPKVGRVHCYWAVSTGEPNREPADADDLFIVEWLIWSGRNLSQNEVCAERSNLFYRRGDRPQSTLRAVWLLTLGRRLLLISIQQWQLINATVPAIVKSLRKYKMLYLTEVTAARSWARSPGSCPVRYSRRIGHLARHYLSTCPMSAKYILNVYAAAF